MKRRWPALALQAAVLAASAALAEEAVPEPDAGLVTHAFGPGAAASIELHVRETAVAPRPTSGVPVGEPLGVLAVREPLSLGLPSAPVRVAPGYYDLVLEARSGGMPDLVLMAGDGSRLVVQLVAAARPAEPRPIAWAEPLGAPDVPGAWPLALHWPTTSGLLVVARARDDAPLPRSAEADDNRASPRRLRTDLLRERSRTREGAGGPRRGPRVQPRTAPAAPPPPVPAPPAAP